jgi:hypothetical protein
LEYNDASHSFNIFNYEDLSLDQVGWLVHHHLDSKCSPDKTYQLPSDPESILNESQQSIKQFKQMKVTAPESSLD